MTAYHNRDLRKVGLRRCVTPQNGPNTLDGKELTTLLINRLFEEEQFDYVFHLAAYAAEGLSHFIKRFNYNNNLIGSINLINASINTDVKCFVFTSSIAVYGSSPTLPMTEETPPHPEDPYGIAKLAVEMELRYRSLFVVSKAMTSAVAMTTGVVPLPTFTTSSPTSRPLSTPPTSYSTITGAENTLLHESRSES